MGVGYLISNDRQARDAATLLTNIDQALSSEQVFDSIVRGLPPQVIAGVRRSLTTEKRDLSQRLKAYDEGKQGDVSRLKELAGSDLGSQLIIARIGRGLSHKELARKLGLHEQAIQRYEADRYRSISLASFQKIATVLGLVFIATDSGGAGNEWGLPFEVDHTDAGKILKHARDHGWLKGDDTKGEKGLDVLKREIGDHVAKHGTPSLLRTGMHALDLSQDLSLLAWKAQIARRAERIIKGSRPRFSLTNVSWLFDLVHLSADETHLHEVPAYLLEKGIVVVFEPQVPGMRLDGASFLVDDVPVIGMTLLKDSIDNFWFTLLHEIAHIVLHSRMGLQAGFFDDFDSIERDELEREADTFASNLLIPEDYWVRSPARITKSAEPVEAVARQLRIHPAIVFGRIRKDRLNYAIFSDRIGTGLVKKALQSAKEGTW